MTANRFGNNFCRTYMIWCWWQPNSKLPQLRIVMQFEKGIYYAEHLTYGSFNPRDMTVNNNPLSALQDKFSTIIGALSGATGYSLSYGGVSNYDVGDAFEKRGETFVQSSSTTTLPKSEEDILASLNIKASDPIDPFEEKWSLPFRLKWVFTDGQAPANKPWRNSDYSQFMSKIADPVNSQIIEDIVSKKPPVLVIQCKGPNGANDEAFLEFTKFYPSQQLVERMESLEFALQARKNALPQDVDD